MFYHNHHRYKSGKKGKAPIALLTKPAFQSDWVTLLLHQVAEKHQSPSAPAPALEGISEPSPILCVSKTNTDVFGTGLRQAHGRFW